MTRNTITFSDLDLNFLANPITKDVSRRLDVNAIKGSVRNLILTSHYERLFHPEIGSSIKSLLFELTTPALPQIIRQSIINTITNFEPRVVVDDITVNLSPDNNSLYVSLSFVIINTEQLQTINLVLDRTR